MNKRHLHHFWTKFRLLKPWYFLIIAAIFGVICVVNLRNNYQNMTVLRDAVYQADRDNNDLPGALNRLRSYVYAHMNTNLASGPDAVYPPIQLKYTYDRLVQAQSAQVAQANSQLYTEAQTYCQQQDSTDFSGRNRVPCITEYVSTHGAKLQSIPDSLYKFSFASPLWSPDMAGWSMVIAALNVLLAVILFVADRWFKKNIA